MDPNEAAQWIREMWVQARQDYDMRVHGVTTWWGMKHMPQWDGGESANGRNYTAVWPKIYKFCLDNTLDPEKLVKAMFHFRKAGPAPLPNMACGQYGLELYQRYAGMQTQADDKRMMTISFNAQRERAASAMSSLQARYNFSSQLTWKLVLDDKTQPLTVLFRYCVATSEGFTDIATKYKLRALEQYLSNKEGYDEIWGSWIPKELKEEAL